MSKTKITLILLLAAILLTGMLVIKATDGHICPEHTCPEPELMPVRDIQIALRDMGYLDADEIDGIWCNQRMIDAWKKYERDLLDESVIYWMKRMEIK